MLAPCPETDVSYACLSERFSQSTLFRDKTWQCSPEPWPLTAAEHAEIEAIGRACLAFQKALELLYRRSSEGKSILRNKELRVPWVAEAYNRGKPEYLRRHALSKSQKGAVPVVLRPDLLKTETGFALTEIDAVPGGIGLTAFLNACYAGAFQDVIEGQGMIDSFYAALAQLVPAVKQPVIACVVSDEADTYRPEFEWLCAQLKEQGKRCYTLHPDEVLEGEGGLFCDVEGERLRIDVLYRFFELFDLDNVSCTHAVMAAAEAGNVVVTPPMRPFQEEKLSLALFHHPLLEDFWREALSKEVYTVLERVVPPSWLLEPVDLPHSAVLVGPQVAGKPIRDWRDLGEASQRERGWILKASGFHETAWGARSVTLGSNCSKEEWTKALDEALDPNREVNYVLQNYKKPALLEHPVYKETGEVDVQAGRLRLCPYYMCQGEQVDLVGILATFCPADKKIIHGMSDAALIPCQRKR